MQQPLGRQAPGLGQAHVGHRGLSRISGASIQRLCQEGACLLSTMASATSYTPQAFTGSLEIMNWQQKTPLRGAVVQEL